VQAYHTGAKGTMAPQELVRVADVAAAAAAAPGGAHVFRAGLPRDRARVIHIALVPKEESARVHLVAVTADARRVFFAVNVSVRSLRAVAVLPSDGLAGRGGRSHLDGAAVRPTNVRDVTAACCAASTLVVAEAARDANGLSMILAAVPNPAGATLIDGLARPHLTCEGMLPR
jgi:hypothetical protein